MVQFSRLNQPRRNDIMKITGWYRIGIVLSALWCLYVISYTIYQYNNPNKNSFLISLEPDYKKPILPTSPRVEAPCVMNDNCPGDPNYQEPPEPTVYYEDKPVINYKVVLTSIIVPIVGVILLILSIKWIIRGFKKKN